MKRRYLKRTIGILLMILIVAAYVHFMQENITGLYNDSDCRIIKSYYLEEPDSLDAVVMGSSEIVNGYLAPEAYRTEGFTSAPYAFSINSVLLWKYELREIERTQQPQVLIIETNGALYEETKYMKASYGIDMLIDCMPVTRNKLEAALALSDEPLERMLPFIKYHYKWPELRDLEDNTMLMINKQGHARLRGSMSQLSRKRIALDKLRPHDQLTADLNPVAKEALADFLEECRTSEIKHIVFVEYPHILNDGEKYARHMRANSAEKMIRDAGFDYIDLSRDAEKIGLDYGTDFHDEDHVVVPGQVKTTRYLAGIISDRYVKKPGALTPENRREWDESADIIKKYCKYYDNFNTGRDPYEKAGFKLLEERHIMEELEKID